MARVLRVPQVTGDGGSAADVTFPFCPDVDPAGKPFVDEQGVPWVEITLRPVTKEQHRAFVLAHTTYVADGSGAMQERVAWEAVHDDVVVAAIVSWRGFVGADDQPLACLDATKRVLDDLLKNQVRARAMYAQPVEVTAASF